MWIRKLFRRGDSTMVTIPRDVRRTDAWLRVQHVEIEYEPPCLIIRPLALEELMRRPRSEEEELPAHASSDAEP